MNISFRHDSDDEENSEDDAVSKNKLKKKFERIAGAPKWADPKIKKSEDSDEEITRSVGHLTQSTSNLLPKETIHVKKLRDVNRATGNEGEITSVIFHPKSTVGIVAGMKGIVSMFSIDSEENKKIHNMQFEKFKIFCCRLNNDGAELIMGGDVSHYHTYDLLTGSKQRNRVAKTMTDLKLFQFSPCGKYIAAVGQYGEVHIINSVTKELICTMKQEYPCTSISFSADSTKLLCHSNDTEITIFDLRMQRIVHKFEDEGCVNGSYVSVSPNGKLIAAGSRQGVVNIYNYEDVFEKKRPKPQKTVYNLTTEITDIQFNPSSELLAICSKEMKNAVKFVHFPSATVFSNFPSQQEQFGKPNVMAFSPAGGFFAVGNLQSKVPLYRIRHYNNY